MIVATVQSIDDTPATEMVDLAVRKVLQGQVGSLTVVAEFAPPPEMAMPKSGLLNIKAIGSAGVWFLKAGSQGYRTVPLSSGFYTDHDAFIPVTPYDLLTPPGGSIDQQLLWYSVRWYQALASPNPGDDARLFRNLDFASQADALAVSKLLVNSQRPDQMAIGLAAAIRRGSDEAVFTMAGQIQSLASSSKLHRLLDALGMYYRPNGPASVSALQNVAAQHLKITGLDAAVGSALKRIGTKDVLPAMAELLDSQDAEAQLRAAGFFAEFALFADKQGNIKGDLVAGPFASSTTRAQTPRRDSAESPSQYAQFWKTW